MEAKVRQAGDLKKHTLESGQHGCSHCKDEEGLFCLVQNLAGETWLLALAICDLPTGFRSPEEGPWAAALIGLTNTCNSSLSHLRAEVKLAWRAIERLIVFSELHLSSPFGRLGRQRARVDAEVTVC